MGLCGADNWWILTNKKRSYQSVKTMRQGLVGKERARRSVNSVGLRRVNHVLQLFDHYGLLIESDSVTEDLLISRFYRLGISLVHDLL